LIIFIVVDNDRDNTPDWGNSLKEILLQMEHVRRLALERAVAGGRLENITGEAVVRPGALMSP
jgi:hypothetical protein